MTRDIRVVAGEKRYPILTGVHGMLTRMKPTRRRLQHYRSAVLTPL